MGARSSSGPGSSGDGDGRADQVGLTEYGDEDTTTRSVVRVQTASGRRMTRTIDGEWWVGSSWHGAASMDGRRGYELVLGKDTGAHAMFFTVLTYRSGQLSVLKAPEGTWTWYLDSSYSFNGGYHRTMSGGMRMTVVTSVRDVESTSSRPHRQVKAAYRWSNGHWARVSTKVAWVSDSVAYKDNGWHVPYLPTFF